MARITLAEEKAMKKKLINDAIDSKTQNYLIASYKQEIGKILTECAEMHKDPSYTTSEQYAADSANTALNRHLIVDLYDLQVALHKTNIYDLPYECNEVIKLAEKILSNSIKHIVEGVERTYATDSLVKLFNDTSIAFSGESIDL